MPKKKQSKDNTPEFSKKPLPADDEAVQVEEVAAPKQKKKKKATKKSKKKDATSKKKKTTKKNVEKKEEKTEEITDVSAVAEAPQEETMTMAPERKKDIDDDLREIYSDKDGLLPDMTTFQTKRPPGLMRALVVLLISLAFLAGVAWFGFFTFQPQARFSEQDVIVSVNGPEEIAIGEEIRYRIKYTNDQAVPLTQATLQVRYPAGFVFVSSSVPATSDSNDTWQLGSLDARASDTIEIYGRLYGDVDTEQSLRAFFNYTPANFSSEFQKVESARTAFTESPIAITMSGPTTVGVGVPAEWIVSVGGIEDRAVTVELTLPEGFVLSTTDPAHDEQAPRAFTLRPTSSTAQIAVRGMFTEAIDGVLKADGYVSLDSDAGASLERVVVTQSEYTIGVSETDVVTNLLINGVMGDFAIQAGDSLNSTIVVQNAGELPMEDVSVRFVVDSPSDGASTFFDWLSIIDESDGRIVGDQRDEDTRRATITWSSAQIPALANLAPGEEVQIPFALPLLTAEDDDLTSYTGFMAYTSADVQYTQDGTRQTSNTNPIDITINSDLRFSTQHTVTPPIEVDGAESHEVTYILENSFHGLENIELAVDIYGDITMGEIVAGAGEATFDDETGTLTWNVQQMPLSLDILPLQYTVDLNEKNPTQTNLTSKVRIRATDVITGEVITIVGSEILLSTDTIPDISA